MNTTGIGQNMLLIDSVREAESGYEHIFRMIPVTTDCPYAECIFMPKYQSLVVATKVIKQQMIMVERLNDEGDIMEIKRHPKDPDKSRKFKRERKTIDTFHDFRIIGEKEVTDFIKIFAINHESFDFKQFFVKPEEVKVPEPELTRDPLSGTTVAVSADLIEKPVV